MPFSPASSCFLPTQVHGAQPPPRARLGCSTGCTPAAAPATIAVAEGPSHERGWGRGWGVWSSPAWRCSGTRSAGPVMRNIYAIVGLSHLLYRLYPRRSASDAVAEGFPSAGQGVGWSTGTRAGPSQKPSTPSPAAGPARGIFFCLGGPRATPTGAGGGCPAAALARRSLPGSLAPLEPPWISWTVPIPLQYRRPCGICQPPHSRPRPPAAVRVQKAASCRAAGAGRTDHTITGGGVPKQLSTRPVRVVPSGVHPLRGAASCSPPSSPPARCRWRPGTRRPGSSAGRRPPRRRRRRCRSWSWRSGRS